MQNYKEILENLKNEYSLKEKLYIEITLFNKLKRFLNLPYKISFYYSGKYFTGITLIIIPDEIINGLEKAIISNICQWIGEK